MHARQNTDNLVLDCCAATHCHILGTESYQQIQPFFHMVINGMSSKSLDLCASKQLLPTASELTKQNQHCATARCHLSFLASAGADFDASASVPAVTAAAAASCCAASSCSAENLQTARPPHQKQLGMKEGGDVPDTSPRLFLHVECWQQEKKDRNQSECCALIHVAASPWHKPRTPCR